jgi:hypothetical protein
MSDQPRARDVQLNRQRQLLEPYPSAAAMIDDLVLEKRRESPPTTLPGDASPGMTGLHTGVPSNYEANLGGERKSMTDFEVKKSPGRL